MANLSTKKRNKTPSLSESQLTRKWILIDAENVVLGRLASYVANILRGKHKPDYTPHMDCGDSVVIINADKVALTGKKGDRNKGKTYYWHTGYPGGIKSTTATKILEGKHPERVVEKAIERMMPGGPLSRKVFSRLRVYAGSENPHTAQMPEKLDFASFNKKNLKI